MENQRVKEFRATLAREGLIGRAGELFNELCQAIKNGEYLQPTILMGPPGVGKTEFAQRLTDFFKKSVQNKLFSNSVLNDFEQVAELSVSRILHWRKDVCEGHMFKGGNVRFYTIDDLEKVTKREARVQLRGLLDEITDQQKRNDSGDRWFVVFTTNLSQNSQSVSSLLNDPALNDRVRKEFVPPPSAKERLAYFQRDAFKKFNFTDDVLTVAFSYSSMRQTIQILEKYIGGECIHSASEEIVSAIDVHLKLRDSLGYFASQSANICQGASKSYVQFIKEYRQGLLRLNQMIERILDEVNLTNFTAENNESSRDNQLLILEDGYEGGDINSEIREVKKCDESESNEHVLRLFAEFWSSIGQSPAQVMAERRWRKGSDDKKNKTLRSKAIGKRYRNDEIIRFLEVKDAPCFGTQFRFSIFEKIDWYRRCKTVSFVSNEVRKMLSRSKNGDKFNQNFRSKTLSRVVALRFKMLVDSDLNPITLVDHTSKIIVRLVDVDQRDSNFDITWKEFEALNKEGKLVPWDKDIEEKENC